MWRCVKCRKVTHLAEKTQIINKDPQEHLITCSEMCETEIACIIEYNKLKEMAEQQKERFLFSTEYDACVLRPRKTRS